MSKWITLGVRVALGFIFVSASVAGMLGKIPPPEPDAAQAFMGALMTSGLLYIVKIVELVCGVALLAGRFVPTALLGLAPIVVNIAFFHAALDPAGLPVSIVLIGLWGATAWSVRDAFGPLVRARPVVASTAA